MHVATALASLILLALLAAPGSAATHCDGTAYLVCDGCKTTNQWKVVVASAHRDAAGKRGGGWCRQMNGGVAQNKIVERPKLGQVVASGYNILYRGNRVGHDRFVIERTWFLVPTNKWVKGTVIYEVDVVAAPF